MVGMVGVIHVFRGDKPRGREQGKVIAENDGGDGASDRRSDAYAERGVQDRGVCTDEGSVELEAGPEEVKAEGATGGGVGDEAADRRSGAHVAKKVEDRGSCTGEGRGGLECTVVSRGSRVVVVEVAGDLAA